MATLSFIPLVEQLSSRVIRILGCNPSAFTLQGTNTYLVGNGSKRILIDASGGEATLPEYLKNLANELKSRNCSIQEILITHYHWDHTEGVQSIFKEITKSPLRVSKYKLTDKPEADSTTNYSYIEDGHEFGTEGATLKAIYTPGHTSDHLCFFLKEENAIFSGDTILGETSSEFEDLYDYMNSLKRIQNIDPTVIYPGHGPIVKNAAERIKTYIDHRTKRNEQIVKALQESEKPLSIAELIKLIYVGLAENLYMGAYINVNNHLKALEKQNLVEQVGDEDWKYKNK